MKLDMCLGCHVLFFCGHCDDKIICPRCKCELFYDYDEGGLNYYFEKGKKNDS